MREVKMNTIIPANPGFYVLRVLEDPHTGICDMYPREDVVAWLITPEEDGVFPITVQFNYAAVLLGELRDVYILRPTGCVTSNFYKATWASTKDWVTDKNVRELR